MEKLYFTLSLVTILSIKFSILENQVTHITNYFSLSERYKIKKHIVQYVNS